MSGLPVMYARHEPDLNYGRIGAKRVALYKPGASIPCAHYPAHFESQPTRRQHTVMHNCATHVLEWLPSLYGPPVHQGEMKIRAMGYGPGLAQYRRAVTG